MKVSFVSKHLSIESFPEIELPDFSVITGLNGTGKTHFLQAIDIGRIAVEGIQHNKARYIDWNSLLPEREGKIDAKQIQNVRNEILKEFSEIKNLFKTEKRKIGEKLGSVKELKFHIDIENFVKLNELDQSINAKNSHNELEEIYFGLVNRFKSKFRENISSFYVLDEVSKINKQNLLEMNKEAIELHLPEDWGRVDVFQNSLTHIFNVYKELSIKNIHQRAMETEYQRPKTSLSNEEFLDVHKAPPWEFLNNALSDSGLGFAVDKPKMWERGAITPILRKEGVDDPIPFSALSSGEKILMSLALCTYARSDNRQKVDYPELLLLDEVDAPLHPSMSDKLVRTLQDSLLHRQNIKIIMTTHSPSTVAVCPDDSIFTMRAGLSGLHPASRGQAINVLCHGLPTLAITFDGRRQVFVESKTDAKVYDAVYQALRPMWLESERSLSFIPATGRKDTSTGAQSGGCTVVRSLVRALRDNGSVTTFGLTDWDGTAYSNDFVKVLAEGSRNGLENCIYDPLLIAALIVRDFKSYLRELNLGKEVNLNSLRAMSEEQLQTLVDKIQMTVLNCTDIHEMEHDLVQYASGFKLKIAKAYSTLDDHVLETRILEKFQFLKAYNRRTGELMVRVAEYVVRDLPEFTPRFFLSVFESILQTEVHRNNN